MKKIIALFLFLSVFNLTNSKVSAVSNDECFNFEVNVGYRMKDSVSVKNVTSLQEFLRLNNYLKVNSTGYFGVQTLNAVKDFQKDNDISSTGFVGPITRSKIQKLSCEAKAPYLNIKIPENISNIPISDSVTGNTTTSVISAVAPDEVLAEPNASSLRVRTSGTVSLTSESLVVRGTVTSGARSGTESWFELTKNPTVYKVSESTVSPKTSKMTNTSFEYLFTGLSSNTMYYYRACAGNSSLGQKSCGGTVSVTTSNR